MINGFITVRTGSSRLPNKCLLKFGKSDSVLEHIIERTKRYNINPIICTSTNKNDDIIEEISSKKNIQIFRGSENNKIKRWFECALKFNISSFHTIDADDLFFDGDRMHSSMKLLDSKKLDYIKPSNYSDSGAATEGYSIKTSFLEKINSGIKDDESTEMAVYFFDNYRDKKSIIIEDPEYKLNNEIPRLTLDFWEDYIMLSCLQIKLNYEIISREYIEKNYLTKDLINLNVSFNKAWKENQISMNPF